MENYWFLIAKEFDVKIYAFVLMPNHFHALLRPTENNLGKAMNYFMRETSKVIGFESGKINQTYGGPHYRTQITSARHFEIAYKYVYRNPVKAGLCGKVEEYPFSTIAALLGKIHTIIPLEEDTLLFNPEFSIEILNWLNKIPTNENELSVQRAIRRRVFQLAKNASNKTPSKLEFEPF